MCQCSCVVLLDSYIPENKYVQPTCDCMRCILWHVFSSSWQQLSQQSFPITVPVQNKGSSDKEQMWSWGAAPHNMAQQLKGWQLMVNQWPPVIHCQNYLFTKSEKEKNNFLSLVNKHNTWWRHRHRPPQPQTVLRGVLSQKLLKPLCLPLKNVLTHSSIGEFIVLSLFSVSSSTFVSLTCV